MTEPVVPEKVDPESLVLRAKPRRIVRIKRNLLIGLCAVGCVAVGGLVWLGLNPVSFTPAMPATSDKDPEKHRTGVPEQISTLPKTYADVPALGQPLPGDLGRPILEAQQAHALAGASGAGSSSVSVPAGGPAQAARVSGLFFQVANAANGSVGNVGNVPATSLSQSLMTMAAPTSAAPVQPEKVSFLESASQAGTVNPFVVRTPSSPSMIMAGTVISAALITGLNSDIPGTVMAQVTSDVHDSLTARLTLIPAGARLLGKYDSTISFGQKRALVVWQRILWPDGRSLDIDNVPASDLSGYSGLQDGVTFHTLSLLKGIGLSTLLGVSAELGKDEDDDLVQALRDSALRTSDQAGQKIVARELDVQPSLTVRPGWPLRVIVQKDLDVSAGLDGDSQ